MLPRMRLLCWLFMLWATPALAQEVSGEAPSDTDEQAARGLFAQGTEAFDDGRNREALSYFEQVHELTGRVELLFNIGLAHQRLGNVVAARDHYERYLLARSDAANRADVEERIAELNALEASAVEEPEEVPAVSVRRNPLAMGLGIGGGAIAAGGAVLFAIGATSTGALDRSQGREWSEVEDEQRSARALQITGISLFAAGAATALIVLVWALTSKKTETGDLAWRF